MISLLFVQRNFGNYSELLHIFMLPMKFLTSIILTPMVYKYSLPHKLACQINLYHCLNINGVYCFPIDVGPFHFLECYYPYMVAIHKANDVLHSCCSVTHSLIFQEVITFHMHLFFLAMSLQNISYLSNQIFLCLTSL